MSDDTHRSRYLHDIPLDRALERFLGAIEGSGRSGVFEGESIPLADALGRVTAEPVWARLSSPHYHAAAMDGYATRADQTRGAF